MANTLVLLERITVGAAGVNSVTFNSIPQTGYTDLKLVMSIRTAGTSSGQGVYLQFNGDSSANYSYIVARGYGSGADSYNGINGVAMYGIPVCNGLDTANTFSSHELYFSNYTNSNYKSISMENAKENNAASTEVITSIIAGIWKNTSAINSILIGSDTAGPTFSQYSTFSLYGVSAVGTTPTKAPKALGGSIIETDGTYWYHAFLSSGTFTPAVGLSCDVLVVAGGGGGLYAGGGAGGVFYATSQALTANTGYTTTIGSGGTGGNPTSTAGADSQFGSLTLAKGGGQAISTNTGQAGIGGSGAGSYYQETPGTSNQTSTGGTGYGNSGGTSLGRAQGAAGGGGAGAAGTDYTVTGTGGAGGAGLNTWSSWLSTTGLGVSGYIAGGGGGAANSTSGAGGSGGGGAGSTTVSGTAGTANTGGGGGGTWAANGGNGGSGLIIVRYAA